MNTRRTCRWLLSSLVAAASALSPASAQEVRTVITKAAFDDVQFELTNAVIARGLTIDYTGNVAGMLARTGADVGSTKPIYKAAAYVTFCSAKLSRQMMEADPANAAFCPYVIFLYETAAKPGEIVVGYRVPGPGSTEPSKAALTEIDTLLMSLIREAVK